MTMVLSPLAQVNALAEALIEASAQLIGDPDLATETAKSAINAAAKRQGYTLLPSRRAPRLTPTRRAEATAAARNAFRRIGERDGFQCRTCGATRDLTIDHITAVVNGGTDHDDNFQILCRSHNSQKGDR